MGRKSFGKGLFIQFFLTVLALVFVESIHAEVVQQEVTYKQGDAELLGFLAYDDAVKDKKPGVLVVHDWMGLTEKTKKEAIGLAEQGYIAFAADIYGKGVRPSSVEEASSLATKYKSDRKLFRARLNAAFKTLKKQKQIDSKKMAAIGFCFGGTGVIELARSGADVNAVVSFHGGLDSPAPADGKKIKARVLALHGADDPYVPENDLTAFEKEMRDAKVDWQIIKYGGAVHSFTDHLAGTDNSKGAAYNEKADRRSRQAMKSFFEETFR